MRNPHLAYLMVTTLTLLALAPLVMVTHARVAAAGSFVGNPPQGTQSDAAYASSFATQHVANKFVTTQQTSCYTPEVPYNTVSDGPNDGYSGESPCPGATTGEDLGPYLTQAGSNPGFPAKTPMLVK